MVADPDVFFPTWDPMQEGTFRTRCASTGRWMGVPHRPGAAQATLAELRLRACARLRSEGFRPVIPKSRAFTNHLWTHTWINGASKVDMRDVYRLEVPAAPRVLQRRLQEQHSGSVTVSAEPHDSQRRIRNVSATVPNAQSLR